MMKPITGFIVLPTKVIALPIFGTTIARVKLTKTTAKVTMKFSRRLITCPPKHNSSTVSLAGSTQSGAAQITANRRQKVPIWIGSELS